MIYTSNDGFILVLLQRRTDRANHRDILDAGDGQALPAGVLQRRPNHVALGAIEPGKRS